MSDTRVVESAATDPAAAATKTGGHAGRLLRTAEIDTRMLGMLGALVVIWIGFHIASGGTFLTPRNMWNLSVQTAVVAIMATGMVLVIVTRNIDLSVGSVMGAVGMVMAILQAEVVPDILGFDHWATWIIVLAIGVAMGAAIGAFQGAIIAYVGVPSFIVTLGGLLVWRGVAWRVAMGRTIAPMDATFQLIGGGSRGAIGGTASWIVGILGCAGIIGLILIRRRQRQRFGFPLRPVWAEIGLGLIGCGAVLGAVAVINAYNKPPTLAGGLTNVPFGIAIPVLITLVVALVITVIATATKFGRYVYAIGGNPEAAELGGINTKGTIIKTFMVMGILVAIAAAVQIARLNAATSGLGTYAELQVIAAAVIGGTSFSGGIGTVPGAVLGALVMQSLVSGMVLMGVDAPMQDVVVGIVLVVAVAIDTIYRRRVVT